MKRFVEGLDRGQSTLFPETLSDFVDEDNPVRVIEAFVEALDLGDLGFSGVDPKATGRPSYHPSVLLKLYIYGYLNRVSLLFTSSGPPTDSSPPALMRFSPRSRQGVSRKRRLDFSTCHRQRS